MGTSLGGTAATTYSSSGAPHTYQSYDAYGEQRAGGTLLTENQFTGQKLDDTGLYYFRARYYDPQIGHFISPDSIVPDATSVFDYNRFMFVRGNPLKYSDPTGHVYELGTGTGGKYRGIAPLLQGYQFANEVLAEAGTWIHNHPNYDPTNDPDLLPSQKTVLHGVYEQLHLEQGNDEVATYHHMRRLGMDNPDIAADMLDVAFSNFVGGGIGLSVSGIILFRAVGPAELLDLQNTGRFSNPAGIEGKYFSLTEEGARQYGNMAEAAFGDPSYSYVETSIPDSSLTSDMMVTVDRGVPAVVVPTDQLDQLAPPRVILD